MELISLKHMSSRVVHNETARAINYYKSLLMNYAEKCCSFENTVVDVITDFASLPEQLSGFGHLR